MNIKLVIICLAAYSLYATYKWLGYKTVAKNVLYKVLQDNTNIEKVIDEYANGLFKKGEKQ